MKKIPIVYRTYKAARILEIFTGRETKHYHTSIISPLFKKEKHGIYIINISKNSFSLFFAAILQSIFTPRYKCKVCKKVVKKYYGTHNSYIICSEDCWIKK